MLIRYPKKTYVFHNLEYLHEQVEVLDEVNRGALHHPIGT
jgi:hypothetical protein